MTQPRLVGLDTARGLAVMGMMTAHIIITFDEKPVDGRSSILFATIAGISIALLTGGAEPPPRAERGARNRLRVRILTRAGIVLALGLALSALNPPLAVILDDYGVYFLLATPLLFLPRPVVLAIAAVLAVVGPLLVAEAVDATEQDPSPLFDLAGEWFLTGFYPAAVWLVFVVVGLVCGRSGVDRPVTRAVMAGVGAVGMLVGYGSPLVVPGVTAAAHSGSTAEILGSGGLALLIVATAITLLDRAGPVSRLLRVPAWPLAAVGSMPLTIYTAHVVGMVIAARSTDPGGYGAYPFWLLPAMIVGALVLASALRVTLGGGPLELLMRKATGIGGGPRRLAEA